MKIFICFSIILAFSFGSCSSDDDPVVVDEGEDKGSILISAVLDGKGITDFAGYTLTVQKSDAIIYKGDMPEGEIIEDLDFGEDYSVEISKPGSGEIPSETPGYYGITRNIKVNDTAVPAQARIVVGSTGAGLYFTYGESLKEEGFENIFPVVKQGDNTKNYASHVEDEYWYWEPGEVTVTLYNGEEIVVYDGKETNTMNLKAGETSGFDISLEKIEIKGPGRGPHVIENAYNHGYYTGTCDKGGGEFVVYIVTNEINVWEEGYMCIALHGFTEPAHSFDEWEITPGTYEIKEDAGAPMTIKAGYYDQNLTQPSFLSWGTASYDREYFELAITEGSVTVSKESNGTFTFVTNVSLKDRNGEIVMKNVRMEATTLIRIKNESPDPGSDTDLSRSQAYIIQTKFMTAFQVTLYRMENADYMRGVTLEGYTDKQPSEEFILTPETYEVVANEEDASTFNLFPGSMREDGNLYGTFGFRTGPMTFTDAWLSNYGDAYVRYNETSKEYTITVTLSGTHLEKDGTNVEHSPFTGLKYEFVGKIEFIDITNQSAPLAPYGYRPFRSPFFR